MRLLSCLGWMTLTVFLTVACGEDPPATPNITFPGPEVLDFSEDLVIDPITLGSPISDVTVKSSAFTERNVAATTENLFEIKTMERRGMKIEELVFDFSSCGLTPEEEAANSKEISVTLVKNDGSGIQSVALQSLEGDGAVFVDVSGVKESEGETVQMKLELVNPSCSSIGAFITYKLSTESVLAGDADANTKLAYKLTSIEELNYGADETGSDVSTNLLSSSRRSVRVFGFSNDVNSFFKMLLLKADLGDCGLKPAEEAAAGTVLRYNLVSNEGGRSFVAADVLDEESQYQSIDYSAHSNAYVEIDNVPASCSSVTARVSHWLGADQKSPEVLRSCSLTNNPSSDVVTWSPDLRAFAMADSSGTSTMDARSVCSSVGVLDESKFADSIEVKSEGPNGDVSLNTYNFSMNGEVISEISCTGSGKLNFIHDHLKLTCSDRLSDVDDVVGLTSSVENNQEGEL